MSFYPKPHKNPEHAEIDDNNRRLWHRVKIALAGRFLNQNGEEYSLETIDVCGGGIRIKSKEIPRIGEKIICYIDGLGRISGTISREHEDGFVLLSNDSVRKRDKLADQLTWLVNKDRLGLNDQRRAERFMGHGPTKITLNDGTIIRCNVIDISIVGIGLESPDFRPTLGEHLTIGQLRGVVARYLPNGFAVDFIK